MNNQTRTPEFIARLQALGKPITPEMITGTIGLYAPLHAKEAANDVIVTRDVRYGEAERHRLDVFAPTPAPAGAPRPMLVFVHGGGFVGGDKTTPGSPFYENVGRWAVRHGFIGVTMTYRLAPQHRWPSGSEDVARAVQHVREIAAAHGGDAGRIFVMGQSAGAVHVAGYIAREHSPNKDGWSPAGAILVSGLYDTHTMDKNPLFNAYFAEDPLVLAQRPFLTELARTSVPLMSVIAELDPPDFLRQFNALNDAYLQQHQRLPYLVQLSGHNHLSTVMHLNTADQSLSRPLLEFVGSV